jgi:hypothetical protein
MGASLPMLRTLIRSVASSKATSSRAGNGTSPSDRLRQFSPGASLEKSDWLSTGNPSAWEATVHQNDEENIINSPQHRLQVSSAGPQPLAPRGNFI